MKKLLVCLVLNQLMVIALGNEKTGKYLIKKVQKYEKTNLEPIPIFNDPDFGRKSDNGTAYAGHVMDNSNFTTTGHFTKGGFSGAISTEDEDILIEPADQDISEQSRDNPIGSKARDIQEEPHSVKKANDGTRRIKRKSMGISDQSLVAELLPAVQAAIQEVMGKERFERGLPVPQIMNYFSRKFAPPTPEARQYQYCLATASRRVDRQPSTILAAVLFNFIVILMFKHN